MCSFETMDESVIKAHNAETLIYSEEIPVTSYRVLLGCYGQTGTAVIKYRHDEQYTLPILNNF